MVGAAGGGGVTRDRRAELEIVRTCCWERKENGEALDAQHVGGESAGCDSNDRNEAEKTAGGSGVREVERAVCGAMIRLSA